MPTWRTWSAVIAGVNPAIAVSGSGPSPHRQATGMPWMLPDGVISRVLKSACASSHSTRSFLPVARQCAATAAIAPIPRQWSPPSMIGIRPACSSRVLASNTARFQATTSSRCR